MSGSKVVCIGDSKASPCYGVENLVEKNIMIVDKGAK